MNRPCKELKRMARQNLSGWYGIPMAALLITGSIPMMAELPFSMLQKNNQPISQTVIFYVADFLISLLAVVLSAGLAQIHLAMARGKNYDLNFVFYGFKNHPDRFILTGFLLTLMQLASLAPLLIGCLAFVEPDKSMKISQILILVLLAAVSMTLIIFLQLMYAFPLYLILDDPNLNAAQALHQARVLVKGQKGRLFYIYLSFIGMQLLNLLTLGIGSLWVMPYQQQTLTNFYLELRGELPPYGENLNNSEQIYAKLNENM